jgi:hypothetical protein
LNSFDPELEENFEKKCFEMFDAHASDLKPFAFALNDIIADFNKAKDFCPTEHIHDCGWSHEGFEFTRGILYAFLNWLESESAEFRAVMKKHGLANDEAFEK